MANDSAKSLGFESSATSVESQASEEPFACSHCGQMLAASCRVCVACHEAVTPPPPLLPAPPTVAQPPVQAAASLEPVRFPWGLFLIFVALNAAVVYAEREVQLILGFAQIASVAWVYYDARVKGVPKPLRWAIGSLLVWPIIFSWYLVRRRTPERPCPFIEKDAATASKVVLIILIIGYLVFLFSRGAQWQRSLGIPGSSPRSTIKPQ